MILKILGYKSWKEEEAAGAASRRQKKLKKNISPAWSISVLAVQLASTGWLDGLEGREWRRNETILKNIYNNIKDYYENIVVYIPQHIFSTRYGAKQVL